jgi:hypothetical protein
MIRFPGQRLSVICLCNRSDAAPRHLAQKVADLYLAEHLSSNPPNAEPDPAAEPAESVELSEAARAARLGSYRSRDQMTTISIEETDAGLAYVSTKTYLLRAISEDRFVVTGVPFKAVIDFEAPADAGRSSFRMAFEGRGERLFDPILSAMPSKAEIAAWIGDYQCPEIGATLRITADDTALHIAHAKPHRRAFETPLEPTARSTEFSGGGLKLEFTQPDEGPQEMRLHMGLVRNLRCVKE